MLKAWIEPRHQTAALVALLLTFALTAVAQAQGAKKKHDGKIVCGSFTGDPKKYPAWNDNMEIVINVAR